MTRQSYTFILIARAHRISVFRKQPVTMVIPVILFVALNVWTPMATTVNVPEDGASNWLIGTTLNTFYKSGFPSPFTTESRDAFDDAWAAVKEEDPVTPGEFTFTSEFISSMEEKAESLEMSSSLKATYMAYSVCF